MYDEKMAKVHFVLSMIGFQVLYFPMFLLLDMPRRIVTYTPQTDWGLLNLTAFLGGLIFGGAQLLLFFSLYRSSRVRSRSCPNSWEAWTVRWALPPPPPR